MLEENPAFYRKLLYQNTVKFLKNMTVTATALFSFWLREMIMIMMIMNSITNAN